MNDQYPAMNTYAQRNANLPQTAPWENIRNILVASLNKAHHHVDAMSLRERVILTVLCSIVLILLLQWIWFDGISKEHQNLEQQIAQVTEQNNEIWIQAEALREAHNNNPNTALRQRLEALDVSIAQVTEQLASASQTLVQPQQIPALLRSLIKAQSGLKLLRIETLPVMIVDVNGSPVVDIQQAENGVLYRHGLELEVSGNFQAIHQWLTSVEKTPAKLQWDHMHYTVEKDNRNHNTPKARLLLRIYTLSMQEVWLRV